MKKLFILYEMKSQQQKMIKIIIIREKEIKKKLKINENETKAGKKWKVMIKSNYWSKQFIFWFEWLYIVVGGCIPFLLFSLYFCWYTCSRYTEMKLLQQKKNQWAVDSHFHFVCTFLWLIFMHVYATLLCALWSYNRKIFLYFMLR